MLARLSHVTRFYPYEVLLWHFWVLERGLWNRNGFIVVVGRIWVLCICFSDLLCLSALKFSPFICFCRLETSHVYSKKSLSYFVLPMDDFVLYVYTCVVLEFQ